MAKSMFSAAEKLGCLAGDAAAAKGDFGLSLAAEMGSLEQ